MAHEGFKRKLTAILSTDVVDYSRLRGADEEATVRTLTTSRKVLTALLQQHNDKVVDSPGDNLLAEFSIVIDAVTVQNELETHNSELPENWMMQNRTSFNLENVIEESDRTY